jgi:hypothetical protein
MFGNPWNGRVVPVLKEPGNGKSKRTICSKSIPKYGFQVKFHPLA